MESLMGISPMSARVLGVTSWRRVPSSVLWGMGQSGD